jgi:uncharacterized protein YbaP (TraB family)
VGRFKCGFRNGWLLSVVGLLGGVVAHADSPVWAIKGAHNTVYLAGSVHLLRKTDAKLPAAFDKAYADASALVMEIDMDDLDPMQAQGWMLENGLYGEEGSLSETIGKARFEKVEQQTNELGLPVEAVERFKPWMAAMTLAQLQLVKLGFDPESGVEKQLQLHAQGDRKEITGFETVQEQLGLLNDLSTADQIKFLDLTLEEMREMQGETDDLLAAWRSGNAQKLSALLGKEYSVAPALYSTLVAGRNRKWIPRIETLLKSDKNYMVVVGTLHIVGKGGLLDLLKADGFSSRQLP